MQVRVILRNWQPQEQQDEPPLLSYSSIRPQRNWLSMMESLAAHVAVVALVSVVSQHSGGFENDTIDWSAYKLEVIRLQVHDPIYFSARVAPPARSRRE